ncbi:MAG: OsmC family protein [Oceanospirillaceae bacterium]|nr:OsmC family protein [Oceanospirillaceae bacterium]
MADYSATILWQRADDEVFTDNRYSRGHEWQFDGGVTVAASSSPHVVPLPYSVEANVDPEEAFVAALSSCHMLFFLSFAAQQGFVVDTYNDQAVGTMAKNSEGKVAMTRVVLRPGVRFSPNNIPSYAQLQALHHASHEACFIANSVTTEVVTEIIEL